MTSTLRSFDFGNGAFDGLADPTHELMLPFEAPSNSAAMFKASRGYNVASTRTKLGTPTGREVEAMMKFKRNKEWQGIVHMSSKLNQKKDRKEFVGFHDTIK